MYLPDTYQVKVILFHKGEKGRTSHKAIDYRAFLDLVYSDEYQQKLKDGKLLGLLTHQGRATAREAHIPHADSVAIDPNFCNILRGVSDDETAVYGYIDLVDTPAAERFKTLWKMGTKIGVSISTELIENGDTFEIKRLHGVDFTLYPEFNAPILEGNFSEGVFTGYADMPIDNPQLQVGNFSNDFSLKDFIRERMVSPRRVLQTRVREVIAFNKSVKKVDGETGSYCRQYLSSYIKRYLNKCVRAQGNVNIIFELGLDQYVFDRPALRELNISMNIAKGELQQDGTIQKATQKRLNAAFEAVMKLLYIYVDEMTSKQKIQGRD